jgi:hypothetical protein
MTARMWICTADAIGDATHALGSDEPPTPRGEALRKEERRAAAILEPTLTGSMALQQRRG